MAHFSLWVPGAKGEPADVLSAVGLADLVSDNDLAPTGMPLSIPGPSGGPGLLIQWIDAAATDPTAQPRIGYHQQQQDWQALPAFKMTQDKETILRPQGTVWIGFEKDRPLRPGDLLRRGPRPGLPRYAGRAVTLGDNHDWILPNQFRLPMEFAIDPETGEDVKVVVGSERPVWEHMQTALRMAIDSFRRDQWGLWNQIPEPDRDAADTPEPLADNAPPEWDDFQIQNYCLWALSLNYRISKLIGVGLHLFNNDNLWPALFETTDMLAIIKVQDALKKTEATWARWRAKSSALPAVSGGEAD